MTTANHSFSLKEFLIGRPIATKDLPHQAISKKVGLAVFASDALSSTAYATEEILVILSAAGLAAATMQLSIPIAIAIAILLIIVSVSYRQTIYAYPNGGGAYIVARDNLGELAAQIAGAALLTDYILTVAVSVSSGVAQITSAFPALFDFRVWIALGVILVMTIVNLRGVRESGAVFSIPTYFFLVMMFTTLGVGAYRYFTGTLPTTVGDVEAMHRQFEPIGWFLILKAFSSGCTALTGIEAISNGITAFKQPRSRNAATTLVSMSAILIMLFIGITLIAHQIAAVPSERETVISQMARTIYGAGSIPYLMTMAGTALILLMAANTSYADFPRLAALHAGDGFLPRQLTHYGSRLVFSSGIITLAVFASILVAALNASVTALIPLYAIGVFLSFTMSQTGMVVRFWKIGHIQPGQKVKGLETETEYDSGWWYKLLVSGFGGLASGVVMIVFAVTKFVPPQGFLGAWVIVLLIPVLVFIFFRIHHHYESVRFTLSLAKRDAKGKLIYDEAGKKIILPVDVKPRQVVTLLLIDGAHAGAAKMVRFAESLGHPWRAVHFSTNKAKAELVYDMWRERIGVGELEVLDSPYRQVTEDIKDEIERILEKDPEVFVHVVLGQLVTDTVAEQMLHQNSSFIFNLALSRFDRVAVTTIPYQIHTVHGPHYEPPKVS